MLKSIHFDLFGFCNWYVHLICLFTFTPLLSIPLWEPCGSLIPSVSSWGLNQSFKGVDLHKWVSLVLFSMILHPHTWTSLLYDLLHINASVRNLEWHLMLTCVGLCIHSLFLSWFEIHKKMFVCIITGSSHETPLVH